MRRIEVTAEILDKEEIADVIEQSLEDASSKSVDILRRYTPVDTGRLRAGWYVDSSTLNTVDIVNQVPYAVEVDLRRDIDEQAAPEMVEAVIRSLERKIRRLN